MLSSSLFCSPASSFVLFQGIRALLPFLFSLQVPLGTNSNHLPGSLGPLGKVRAVSFWTKIATGYCCSECIGVNGTRGAGLNQSRQEDVLNRTTRATLPCVTLAATFPQEPAKLVLQQKTWNANTLYIISLQSYSPWLPNSFCIYRASPQSLGPYREMWQGFRRKPCLVQLTAHATATALPGEWEMGMSTLLVQGENSHFWMIVLRPFLYCQERESDFLIHILEKNTTNNMFSIFMKEKILIAL